MLGTVIFVLLSGYVIALLAWHTLQRRLLATALGIHDLPLLVKVRRDEDKFDGTAVVCGGSIAGLLTARVCHAHFRKVLVVEPEAWAATEEARILGPWNQEPRRTRLLQRNSLHGSQPPFFAGMLHLFAKLEAECARARLKQVPPNICIQLPVNLTLYHRIEPYNARPHLSGRAWMVPERSLMANSLYTTRAALEKLLRRLVLDKELYPNISWMTGTVVGTSISPTDPLRIDKVVVRSEAGVVEEMPAMLVADCAGPARAGVKWLRRQGFEMDPLKITIDQKLRYSTMLFKMDEKLQERLPFPDELQRILGVYMFLEDINEETRRMGKAMFVIILVLFAGHYGAARAQPKTVDELPTYVQELRTLEPIPEWIFGIIDILREVQDTAIVSLVNPPPTTYVQYHLARELPVNFVALGDSVMTINPVFGEGCTKALRCVMVLQKQLLDHREISASFSSSFFEHLHIRTGWMWENTRTQDYGLPTTIPIPGESLSLGSFTRWYVKWFQRLAVTDSHAGRVMHDMVCGMSSPVDALHPHLIVKVCWAALTIGHKWRNHSS
ncbi:hypothetical protein MIND_00377900 [Mycena indigotica]|uniref:Uncharacterized protein n=1 Tax=Mycena indigotica TaxID=2126181 RepID=A0A8H6W8W3_9AGAR|nr:uncharacterized protein MIND_00377900 [Mycena indigotica]KAF7310049.1 hypothetical protein MIND_00377900 [Mycena indigotica]